MELVGKRGWMGYGRLVGFEGLRAACLPACLLLSAAGLGGGSGGGGFGGDADYGLCLGVLRRWTSLTHIRDIGSS
jgi:hypothetical protein